MTLATVTTVGAALLLLLVIKRDEAFAQGRQLLASIIEVNNSAIVGPLGNNEVAPGQLIEKIKEARTLLAQTKPKVGLVDIVYIEDRITVSDSGEVSLTSKEQSDPELEIPLALLETATGKIHIVTVIHRGNELISPPRYPISIVQRTNGIRWNLWNTEYMPPRGYIVLLNNYPEIGYHDVVVGYKTVRGKQKAITGSRPYIKSSFLYTPYTEGIHTPEMVQAGREYLQKLAWEARETLRDRRVRSLAFPSTLVADVAQLQLEFFEHLPIIEHSDMTEFRLNPQRIAERVLVRIAANKEESFNHTCSGANACGLMQYTPKTYQGMRKEYPAAKLNASFSEGVRDHKNIVMAAMLLHDYNLRDLIKNFGKSIAQSPQLEEYLAAAYNGAPRHTYSSLKAFFRLGLSDWILGLGLREETKGYMMKIRKLNEMNIMTGFTIPNAPAL